MITEIDEPQFVKYCDRCKMSKPSSEFTFRPLAFNGRGGFEHTGPGETIPPAPCGFLLMLPPPRVYDD